MGGPPTHNAVFALWLLVPWRTRNNTKTDNSWENWLKRAEVREQTKSHSIKKATAKTVVALR